MRARFLGGLTKQHREKNRLSPIFYGTGSAATKSKTHLDSLIRDDTLAQ